MSRRSPVAVSALWRHHFRESVTAGALDLTDFKRSPVNFKLALWNPQTNGVRYLKALTFLALGQADSRALRVLGRTRRRDFGHPYSVRRGGVEACLDYAQAALETEFILSHLPAAPRTVFEIGAGYGRTCHTLLSNSPIERYTILDLPNCLELSRRYLHKVLPARLYARVEFVDVARLADLRGRRFDLGLNIDSFAEMTPTTVRFYLKMLDASCGACYIKNPVGKYLDPSLDNHSQGAGVVRKALRTGLLRRVIDVYDEATVHRQAPAFVRAYKPGPSWSAAASGWAAPWSHYWQALYLRKRKAS